MENEIIKNTEEMSDIELEQEMKDRQNWDSRYFLLEDELESREPN